jgi:hypothetical protein
MIVALFALAMPSQFDIQPDVNPDTLFVCARLNVRICYRR